MSVGLVVAFVPATTGRFAVLAITYDPPMRPARLAPPSLRNPRDLTMAKSLLTLFGEESDR